MSSSPKPPKPVDPNVAARAQAEWNRFGTQTPFGSTRWEGEGPNSRQVVEYSPELMELFGAARQNAMRPRDEFQNPESFGSILDRLGSRLNDRGNMGRPVYQPTQTYGGTLGIGGGSGGGGGPVDQAPPTTQPNSPMQANFGMQEMGGPNKPPANINGSLDVLPYVGKPQSGMPGESTQPVPPGAKNLGMGGGMGAGGGEGGLIGTFRDARAGGSQTPWRDAFLGPADAQGNRNPIRNFFQRGGPAGMIGAGLGGSLGNAMYERGQAPNVETAMANATRPRAIPVPEDKPGILPADPVGNPFKPRRGGKPIRSNAGRMGRSLGLSREATNMNRELAALEALGLHRYDDQER